ncbi:MAG: YceI family protein [Solirubrobacterales bacterium]
MSKWIFEPGHSEAAFRARHMMVTWVSGAFKDVHGHIDLDRESWEKARFEGEIEAAALWTGEENRDAHLRNADFFDVENHPKISFEGGVTDRIGETHFKAEAELTIRGTTQTVPLDVEYLGEWETPFWVGDENKGSMQRIGFEATTRINRHDFGVSWNGELPGGGVVVGREIPVTLNVEAIAIEDLERTGAIEDYR